jgi:DNA-binding HxlR family transcriptional regulator
LSLLAVSLNVSLLRALEEEGKSLAELRQAVGYPPASTMRTYLRELTELGIVERERETGFPGSVGFGITHSGEMLLAVGKTLQRWLDLAPDGPVGLGAVAAKSATKALVDGWSTGIVRALAARPFALTELDRLLPQLSYPSLERRLTAMRTIGQVEAQPERASRGTPYRATEWLRRAAAPLTAAIGWERHWIPGETRPPSEIDVEATFLLAVPLLDLPPEVSGVCRLAVELRNGSETSYAGVKVEIDEGRMVSCLTRFGGDADAWASGSLGDWLRWSNGSSSTDGIEVGGDGSLARTVMEGFLSALSPGDLAWQGR